MSAYNDSEAKLSNGILDYLADSDDRSKSETKII